MVAVMVRQLPRFITKSELANLLEYKKTTQIKKDYPTIVKALGLTEKEYNRKKRFTPHETAIIYELCKLNHDE